MGVEHEKNSIKVGQCDVQPTVTFNSETVLTRDHFISIYGLPVIDEEVSRSFARRVTLGTGILTWQKIYNRRATWL
jgi:hypothetical protein